MVTLQPRQIVISKTKSNQTMKKETQKARVNSTRAAYSAVSTKLPTTPTPSTCFSNNCTFSLSSSNLCFSSIHRISRRSYRLPSACKLPIAVSSARRRSSSRASLLLEGDPSRDDDEARESCSSSDDEREARRRAASSAKALRMATISGDSWRVLSRRTARDATEWSLPVWEGAASNTRVVSVSRSRVWNCDDDAGSKAQ